MSSSEEAERLEATTFKVEAPRIPQLFPSTNSSFALRGRHHRQPNLHPNQQPPSQQQQQPFHQRSAADIMLGLKTLATHADRQVPVIHVHDRSSMPSFPSLRPSSSSGHAHRSTATGFLPPIVAVDRDQQSSSRGAISPPTGEKSQCHKVAPVPFVEYLGRKNKRGEPRLPDNATSPTSRFSAPSSERERDITLSPLSTASPAPRILPVSTTIAWRSSSSIFSPNSSKRFRTSNDSPGAPTPQFEASHPGRESSVMALAPLEPQRSCSAMVWMHSTLPLSSILAPSSATTEAAANQPQLVQKVPSKWRHELADQDRRKTRERIQRGLVKHCEDDYDVLLLLIASMEEELLHIKTNSKEHYYQQAHALSAEVQHASLER